MPQNILGSLAKAFGIIEGQKSKLKSEEENKRRWEADMAERVRLGDATIGYQDWTMANTESTQEYERGWEGDERARSRGFEDEARATMKGAQGAQQDLYAPQGSEYSEMSPKDIGGDLMGAFKDSYAPGRGIFGAIPGVAGAIGAGAKGMKERGPQTFESERDFMSGEFAQGLDPAVLDELIRGGGHLGAIETPEQARYKELKKIEDSLAGSDMSFNAGKVGGEFAEGMNRSSYDIGVEMRGLEVAGMTADTNYKNRAGRGSPGSTSYQGPPAYDPKNSGLDPDVIQGMAMTGARTPNQFFNDLWALSPTADPAAGQNQTFPVPGEFEKTKTPNWEWGGLVQKGIIDAEGYLLKDGQRIPETTTRWIPDSKGFQFGGPFFDDLRRRVSSGELYYQDPTAAGSTDGGAVPDWVPPEYAEVYRQRKAEGMTDEEIRKIAES